MTLMKTDKLKFAVVLGMGLGLGLGLAVLMPSAAWAAGEVNGRLGGTVSEAQTGAPVPGATVTVSSKGLIGGPRTVTTGDDGRYELVELPPGTYNVEVSYSGVKPIKRRVAIRQGELLPLDIQWSAELAEAEVTVVVEERHLTKPDSTQSGTVISSDQTSKIASGRSYQDIASQVAGTVDVNGGGNPQIKGGNLMGNRYLVDGLDVTDPVTNTFSANMNFDSISSIDVITGGMEAQYNAIGGIINLITAGGSDEWHIDASLYVNNNKFSAEGQYGANVYNGETPFSRVKPAPTQSYQANVNVSGPIIKHRLWFNVSFEFDYTESSTPAGPPLNLQAPTRRFTGYLARLKLTWAPNDKHRVTLSASADPAFIENVSRSSANRRLPIAQNRQNQGGIFAILQWDWFINQHINTNVQTGFHYQFIDFGPQGATNLLGGAGIDDNGGAAQYSDKNRVYNFDEPQHVNLTDNTIWYQGDTSVALDKRYKFQFDPSISMRGKLAGSHDSKIGINLRYGKSTYDIHQTGKGVSYADLGGAPLEAGLCNEATGEGGCFQKTVTSDYGQEYQTFSIGAYVQDRWKPWKRMTILPGIRFDYGLTKNAIGETASSLFGVGPRLGFNLDLTGDQKTIFLAFYGRANEVGNILPAAYGSPSALSTTYGWDGSGFNQVVSKSGGGRGYQFDPNATTPPHTDEVLVGLRREIFANSVASVEYTYKRISNLWDWQEINQLWDPSGFRQLTDANGNPLYVDNANPQKIYKISTNHNNIREYHGIDFTAESRPSENWDIYVAYTLAWLYGTAGEEFGGQVNGTVGAQYNPRQSIFWQGYLPEDVRHVLKIRASYNNHGFNAGTFLQFQTGAPLTRSVLQYLDGDYLNYRTPVGTEPNLKALNDPRQFSEFRLPDTLSVDLRISYDFNYIWKGAHHLILIADLFNLFNLRPATGITETDTPTYGQVTTRQGPFKFQLGLRYVY